MNTFEELKGIEKHMHAYSKTVIIFMTLCLVFCNARSTTVEDGLEGFGMSDGEVMERLWSYLRPTAKITKEMTPAHRVDTLTDFLMHYAKKSILNLGNLAVNLHVLQIQLSP